MSNLSDISDFEDERGNLWEAPDDEGRIRVRDLDGDLVTWYDPDDEGYDDAIARFSSRVTECTCPDVWYSERDVEDARDHVCPEHGPFSPVTGPPA